jgi:hypothetical protein
MELSAVRRLVHMYLVLIQYSCIDMPGCLLITLCPSRHTAVLTAQMHTAGQHASSDGHGHTALLAMQGQVRGAVLTCALELRIRRCSETCQRFVAAMCHSVRLCLLG